MFFPLGAQPLMLAGQFQRRAQMIGWFIAIKARLIGRYFEQDAARCAELDRPKVVAINDWGDLIAGVEQRLPELQLHGPVWNRKGDVVDRLRPRSCTPRCRLCLAVDASAVQPGRESPSTSASAKASPSGALKLSQGSPKRVSSVTPPTPFTARRRFQSPNAPSLTENTLCEHI